MNILLIDDQISVLDGLKSSINFADYGISQVFTATNADDARSIISSNQIDIMLSDIEMPGEDGLSLNQWVFENYPSILRVLLTSHASFSYAQKSVKLGCFDYLIQPATKEEIDDLLKRATAHITKIRRHDLYNDNLYMSSIVENLFNRNKETQTMALASLAERGYVFGPDTLLRTVIINLYPYQSDHSTFKPEYDILAIMLNVASFTFHETGIIPLVCKNRYKQFVLALFSNDSTLATMEKERFIKFYDSIAEIVSPKVTCYVSDLGTLSLLREIISSAHELYQQDVTQDYTIHFSSDSKRDFLFLNQAENISRWNRLLENKQFETLKSTIFSYLDYHSSLGQINYTVLCELHQDLSKIFLMYLYKQTISINTIFTEEYTYPNFMNCYETIQSLKEGIAFLIERLSNLTDGDSSQDAVQRAVNFILSNLSSDISVKEVAEHVHLNPEYFSKLFKKEMKENVKNYILRIKVDAAKDMLENPNIPVSIISLELGYYNFSHFTQMFKKHEGITPTEYRKRILHNPTVATSPLKTSELPK